jgi:predicted metalloprotease with PDZ domain
MPKLTKTTAPIHYRVEMPDLHTHLYQVTLTVPEPDALQRLTLPAWIPGSYLIREFARHLQGLQAHQGRRALPVEQQDKSSWVVACTPGRALELRYTIYANDASVRTAWLDATRGFFNGTSLCLHVEGRARSPHTLELCAPRARTGWSVATGLAPVKVNARGFGTYAAADYDELADSPFELGAFWSGEFKACGVPHRFVVAGAPPAFDGARLLADTKKICETAIRFWHGGRKPPHKSYVFMLNATEDSYGGLEHRKSTALICARRDLPRVGETKTSEGYTTLLGLVSHEYFHTWNVKRLRPAEFSSYDYAKENYTRLLWFFEGFTSYYDDLLLRRAGLLDDAGYLKLLNKTINQVLQTPGRRVQSVAQASFDAWVKYYRPDENTPNATVSYYTKGALVALCLDLTLRQGGNTSLDTVMRALWTRCQAGPMQEGDLLAVLTDLGGRDFSDDLTEWVHGTADLPLQALLTRQGVAVHEDAAQPAQRLGLRVAESAGIQVKVVLRDGAAERAGFSAGDEWLAVKAEGDTGEGWRLNKLEDLSLYTGPSRRLTALVARDKRLLQLPLELPERATTWRLAVHDAAGVASWLTDGQ